MNDGEENGENNREENGENDGEEMKRMKKKLGRILEQKTDK